jgi:hypothetical protein
VQQRLTAEAAGACTQVSACQFPRACVCRYVGTCASTSWFLWHGVDTSPQLPVSCIPNKGQVGTMLCPNLLPGTQPAAVLTFHFVPATSTHFHLHTVGQGLSLQHPLPCLAEVAQEDRMSKAQPLLRSLLRRGHLAMVPPTGQFTTRARPCTGLPAWEPAPVLCLHPPFTVFPCVGMGGGVSGSPRAMRGSVAWVQVLCGTRGRAAIVFFPPSHRHPFRGLVPVPAPADVALALLPHCPCRTFP